MNNKEDIEILRKGYPDINRYAPSELENYDDDVRAYDEAVGYAISHLETDRWIPVTERLPEKDKNVLVTDNEVSEAYITFYMGDGLWCCDDGVYEHRITHWKPVPKPYESEGK